jgi:thymidylate synthase (FAD)
LNILTPYAKLLSPPSTGITFLRTIEFIGRVSHRAEEAQTPDSWDRFIRAVVVQRGDWSITEHCSLSVEFVVDRGVTHEIVRHRLAAYTQESTRFVNYEKKLPPGFIKPEFKSQGAEEVWKSSIEDAERNYKSLLAAGEAPQIARSVFPNSLAAKLVMTCNLRNWRHFFLMRTTRETHPQLRQVTLPLLAEFQTLVPILYEDIVPLATQRHNLSLGR